MSFLNEEETASLTVRRMILHVVGGVGEFEAQKEMADLDHSAFFLDRIRGAAIDGVHSFEAASDTKLRLERIARGDVSFEAGAQELSRSFSKAHVEASREGVFFVFELGVGLDDRVIYCLMKYDYRNVLELTARDGRQSLRSSVQAFVTERRAIQKSCLVRVVGGKAEDLASAFDRMGRAPDLTDYFGRFLEVRRSRSDVELTTSLGDMLGATLSSCREVLPGRDVVAALEASKGSLLGREVINENAVREAILVGGGSPQAERTRSELDDATTKQLKRHGLSGVEFRPAPAVLAQRPRLQIKTVEGVVLSYPGEEEGKAVRRERDGSGWTITIRTKRDMIQDATLASKARGGA